VTVYRFAGVIYNSGSQTADIGAGLVWDDVYAALELQWSDRFKFECHVSMSFLEPISDITRAA
jgi:hypothetical protein